MTLNYEFSYSLLVLYWYGSGFAVLAPPLAWGGLAVGWWMRRADPLASRLAGGLLAAVVGAAAAASWQHCRSFFPALDTLSTIGAAFKNFFGPLGTLLRGAPGEMADTVIFYAPPLLALLLCVVASRYEEALSGAASRFRERVATRRADREARRAEEVRRLTNIPAGLPETLQDIGGGVPAMASAGAVIAAPAGGAVALPAQMMVDGEARPVFIVVKVDVPPPPAAAPVILPRVGRGGVSGFFVGTYYATATVSKLWLPLALLGLWLFWAPLVTYAEQQAIETGSAIGSRVVKQFKLW